MLWILVHTRPYVLQLFVGVVGGQSFTGTFTGVGVIRLRQR